MHQQPFGLCCCCMLVLASPYILLLFTYLLPVRTKIKWDVGVAHTSPLAWIVRRYLYPEGTIEKEGSDFPVAASGLDFLWVQSQPKSDALIGARFFVLNFVSLHPSTSRNF
ncbi:hypothetical protein ATANTOWER_002909 [Ataeniobius toweri]|uniref:Secreted protein n=1 Tax=Ataeniobius toweri TaxID=208326 RepID=A0ABU7B4N8_9TELE|nr:hypothetical protein [Ataeniobius toweri]